MNIYRKLLPLLLLLGVTLGMAGGAGAQTTAYGVSSPSLWYQPSTLPATNGVNVTSWPDSSGNGITMTAPTGHYPTVNTSAIGGQSAAVFNGTSSQLIGTNYAPLNTPSTGYSFSVVCNLPTTSAGTIFTKAGGGGSWRYWLAEGISGTAGTVGMYSQGPRTGVIGGTGAHIITYTVTTTGTASIYVDGTLSATGTETGSEDTTTAFSVGALVQAAAYYLNGSISEILYWNHCYTAGERYSVETGLGSKYAIAISTPLTVGSVSVMTGTPATVTLTATTAVGGSGTYTYQWFRNTTYALAGAPAAGTALSGATSLTLTDTPPATGTLYYYTLQVTDTSNSASLYYPIMPAATWQVPIKILVLGDSIQVRQDNSGNTAWYYAAKILSQSNGNRAVTVVNQSVPGTYSLQWSNGYAGGYLASAIAAGNAAGCNIAVSTLGVNDSAAQNITAAAYGSNTASEVAGLTAAGYKVILNYPSFVNINAASNSWTTLTPSLLLQYQGQINSLVNNSTVFLGDTQAYNYIAMHPEQLADGVHPNDAGVQTLGQLYAVAVQKVLTPSLGIGNVYLPRRGR